MSGCEREFNRQYQDALVKKTREDYEKILTPPCGIQFPDPLRLKKPRIETPECCRAKVSISISGNIPVTEALMHLANQIKINIAINAPASKMSKVTYKASDQPFIEVLDTICTMAGLRYYFVNSTLHVCDDTPYIKTHNIQFLLGTRNTQSHTSVQTDVFSDSINASKHSQNADNGANISLNSKNMTDFWQELERALDLLLSTSEKARKDAYSLNKYSGSLSVFGTDRQQKMIEAYLLTMQKLIGTQVLIEAKIMEVTLSDDYKAGINWGFLFGDKKNGGSVFGPFNQLAAPGTVNPFSVQQKRDVFSFSLASHNFSSIASFLEKFGTTRTIANPRITVLNNQAAILKVARNEVFFQLQVEDIVMQSPNPPIQKTESKIQTVPIGLIMFVQPSVNFETGEIILYIHATISRVTDYREDPSVSIASKGHTQSRVPVTQMRELNTVITGRQGETVVTGGLMEEVNHNETNGIPEASQIPIIGGLFSEKENRRQVTELVILMKLSVIESGRPQLPCADERLYRSFTQDPRPF